MRGEIELTIMTALGGAGRIHGGWNQFHRGIEENGHGQHTRFSNYGTKFRKNSDLRSQLKRGAVSGGVKGRDERQKTAPLTPPLTATGLLCLDTGQRRHTGNDRQGKSGCVAVGFVVSHPFRKRR